MTMAKNTICLWYDKDAEAAARFYAETFPDSAVTAVRHAPATFPRARRAMCCWSNSLSQAYPASA